MHKLQSSYKSMESAYSNLIASLSNHLSEYWLGLAIFSQSVDTYLKEYKTKMVYREGYFGCSFLYCALFSSEISQAVKFLSFFLYRFFFFSNRIFFLISFSIPSGKTSQKWKFSCWVCRICTYMNKTSSLILGIVLNPQKDVLRRHASVNCFSYFMGRRFSF